MSEPTAHPSDEKLGAYNRGMLPPEEAVAIETHVSECEPCCATIVSLSSDDTFVCLLKEARQLPMDHSPEQTGQSARLLSHHGEVPAELVEHPRYALVRLIGKGGMGDVYEAIHRKMERKVAIKVINRELFQNTEAVNRFHREVKAAAQLSHPNIVTAFDADQAGDYHFMVMESVDGVNLAQVAMEQGALPVADACDYIRQAANGLQHAHERGMVHRDIKPHNLMVTRGGTIKILDFGLASLAPEALPASDAVAPRADLTAAGAVMGTPDFISPEQAKDARQADIRSDIYSLGATLYFLLSGRVPFADGSVMHKLRSHAQVQPESLSSLRDELQPELVAIVSRMMAKNPDERYLAPREVADALESYTRSTRRGEVESQQQQPVGGGNMSGSGRAEAGIGDRSSDWLSAFAKWLFYVAFVPIALLLLDVILSDDASAAAGDRPWFYLLASISLSAIAGVVSGIKQFKTTYSEGHRGLRWTADQTWLIAGITIVVVVYSFQRDTGAPTTLPGSDTENVISSGPFHVDGKTGHATGRALGIDFVVVGATGVRTDNQLASGRPEQSAARLEITLAEDVVIRLEKFEDGGPVSFHLNGVDFGSLKKGQQVVIDGERNVTVDGTSRQSVSER